MQIAWRDREMVSFLLHYILNAREKKIIGRRPKNERGTYIGRVLWPLVHGGGRRAAQRRAPATYRKANERWV